MNHANPYLGVKSSSGERTTVAAVTVIANATLLRKARPPSLCSSITCRVLAEQRGEDGGHHHQVRVGQALERSERGVGRVEHLLRSADGHEQLYRPAPNGSCVLRFVTRLVSRLFPVSGLEDGQCSEEPRTVRFVWAIDRLRQTLKDTVSTTLEFNRESKTLLSLDAATDCT